MMKIIILAAGLSTRLHPLTSKLPKPMLLVCGHPFIEYLVRQVVANGYTDVIITTHYLPERIVEHFGDGSKFGAHIQYAHEERLMNTAGSIKSIEDWLDDDFMVIGGSNYLPELDLGSFYDFHKKCGGIGTIAFKQIKDKNVATLFGQGVLDNRSRLISFHEKANPPVTNLIHTSYQIYQPRALKYLPADVPTSIPNDLIKGLLEHGENVFGYVTDSEYVCISTRELYECAQTQLSHCKGE